MLKSFDDVFEDVTKFGTKIKTDEYQPSGKYQIIDQGQAVIAGYTDLEDGVFENVPAIIFGDHTRIVKYVDKPFFLGADGVKVLRCRFEDADYRYLYYALKSLKIPNTGYNRHFKWLKEEKINYPNAKYDPKLFQFWMEFCPSSNAASGSFKSWTSLSTPDLLRCLYINHGILFVQVRL